MAVSQSVLELLIELKDQASSGLNAIGSALSTVGGIAGGAALAGIGAFTAGVVSGIGDAREAAQVMAQTEAVIKSTGGAAGVTAEQIADMAGQLSAASGKSLFGDSDIQKGQNLLLTFTNITDTLPETTQVMVDMAQAMGTDVSGGAIQLGKALNDPINGISALSRVGVSFTDQQKEQIKTMQEAGDMAGAQRIILAELNKEFGGSAAAAAAADGGWAQFNDRMGEAFESLGALVLPALNTLATVLNDPIMPTIEGLITQFSATAESSDFVGQAVAALGEIWNTVLLPAIQTIAAFFMTEIMPILQDLATALIPVVIAALQLLAGIWVNVLLPALSAAWGFFKDNILPILAEVARWLADEVPPAIQTTTDFFNNQILPAVQQVHGFLANTLIPGLRDVITWLGNTATKAMDMATAFSTNLQNGIAVVSSTLNATFAPAVTAAKDIIAGAQTTIGNLATWFGNIADAAAGAVRWVNDVATAISNVKVPEWLQGHSPPPMADWFSYISQSAQDTAGAIARVQSVLDDTLRSGLGGVFNQSGASGFDVAGLARSLSADRPSFGLAAAAAASPEPIRVKIDLNEGRFDGLLKASIKEDRGKLESNISRRIK